MIKREARILGLATPTRQFKRTPTVGVVYRGNLWLDGVITCLSSGRNVSISSLTQAITHSKQYPQIHAIILSEDFGMGIDISDLFHETRLPVISIVKETARLGTRTRHGTRTPNSLRARKYEFKLAGESVQVEASGINLEDTREVFTVACAEDTRIPEAVRVAKIIADCYGDLTEPRPSNA